MTAVLIIAALAASAQSPAGPSASPRAVVERFCRLDWDGGLLTAAGAADAAPLLVSPGTWSPIDRFRVVDSYAIRGRDQITVDYRVWGEVDSSLRFVRLEGLVANRPVATREYVSTVLSPRPQERGPGGPEGVKGSVTRRIAATPAVPHVSLETALRHVTAMRERSSDPALRENATGTLAVLRRLASPSAPGQGSPPKTAAAVVTDFRRMDAEGMQLIPDGWQAIAAMFTQPGSARLEKIGVLSREGLSYASIADDNTAGVRSTITYVGWVDVKSGRLEPPSDGVMLLHDFSLVLTNPGTSPAWKIEGPVPAPSVTVTTAIQYLARLRANTADAGVRKNADRTLAILKKARPSR
jgi:hypothetical protein